MTSKISQPKRPLSIHGPTAPERQWIRILSEWHRSDLEGAAFCRKRGLSYSAFRFWKKEIPDRERRRKAKNGASKAPVRLLPVRVRPTPSASAQPLEVLVAGQVIRVVPDFDPETFRRIVHVLEGWPTLAEVKGQEEC